MLGSFVVFRQIYLYLGVSASVSHHNREFSLFIDYEYIFISIPFVSALTTIVTLCYNFVNKQSERLQN